MLDIRIQRGNLIRDIILSFCVRFAEIIRHVFDRFFCVQLTFRERRVIRSQRQFVVLGVVHVNGQLLHQHEFIQLMRRAVYFHVFKEAEFVYLIIRHG
ncbi:hypothetical protein SDC9_158176 [bioreactor metagenome]|uniref:Uncharacterized protein n=1 Tax=bioreactor metagenome TaxID=1076179 RepID=A0A645FC13_9ZZZZ